MFVNVDTLVLRKRTVVVGVDALGYASAICFSLCYLPQIIKTYRVKTVDDISIWLWILSLTAYIFGGLYGILINKIPLVVNYGAGFLFNSIIIGQWIWYKRSVK